MVQTDGNDGRTDAHQNFEAPYSKALRAIIIPLMARSDFGFSFIFLTKPLLGPYKGLVRNMARFFHLYKKVGFCCVDKKISP